MPMRFPRWRITGYPWWTFTPERIGHWTITGRQECADCGGRCCAPARNVIVRPIDRKAPWPREEAMRSIAECGPQFELGRIRTVNGEPRARFRCRLAEFGPCPEDMKPTFCQNFPMNHVADAILRRERFRANHWCRLARNLLEEYRVETGAAW